MMNTFSLDSRFIFELGDQVEFEVALKSNKPRWSAHNEDRGESHIWAKGTVVFNEEFPEENIDYYCIKFEIPNMIGSGICWFPKPCSVWYKHEQWTYPGYLRKLYTLKCVCGSEKIYGKETKLHSFWCEKSTKEKK